MDELAELPLEAFCDLLQEKGKGRFKQPEKIAKAIQRAITMSYRLGALAQESINVVLSVLVREIRALEKNIKELDKAIEQVIVVIPEYQCLTSIPGVGKVYAAGLIAEIGQIERFEDQTKLAKYAGLSWKVNQSGNYQSQNTPLTKQGNRYFRSIRSNKIQRARSFDWSFRFPFCSPLVFSHSSSESTVIFAE
ncbi:hypothetical protein EfmAA290_19290 [Enterococcus faecium]|nr:hypothetical protein EfmAA290_19290 [Enterococcus faecium]